MPATLIRFCSCERLFLCALWQGVSNLRVSVLYQFHCRHTLNVFVSKYLNLTDKYIFSLKVNYWTCLCNSTESPTPELMKSFDFMLNCFDKMLSKGSFNGNCAYQM